MGVIWRIIRAIFTPSAWDLWKWAYLWGPALIAALTIGVAAVVGEPLHWVIVAWTLAFAGTASGLVRFGEWRAQNIVEHKMVFLIPLINRGEDVESKHAQIAFRLENKARFPIEVHVDELRTSVAGRINPTRELTNRKFLIGPEAIEGCHDASINIGGVADEIMQETLELKLSYGRPGKRRYFLLKSLNLYIPLDRAKKFTWDARAEVGSEAGTTAS